MSYNWQSAATLQGRERLKELLDKGIRVVGKVGQYGRITAFWKHEDGAYDVDCYLPEPFFLERNLSDVEFLDPDQDSQIAAMKAENERMRNALRDIEADARAKLASNLPLNSNETLHSVKHGLGQMFVNSKSGDIGSVIEAIARTFAKDDDFCA